ncbi:nucleoside deaminase [Candidatus Saccharibacteria bacterium]|nr:nucleoside deaminase [Candidatus Saccharibacteria bacterium]
MYQPEYMQVAINEARTGIRNGDGGPFGAAIVKDGKIIASGHNCVLKNHDSTCHGEIDAIRKAEQSLKTHDLSGCEIYTTGEPCPMCLAAILWANIKKIYYGCNLEDNEKIGFRDVKFEEIMKDRSLLSADFLEEQGRDLCLELFEEYDRLDKALY